MVLISGEDESSSRSTGSRPSGVRALAVARKSFFPQYTASKAEKVATTRSGGDGVCVCVCVIVCVCGCVCV